MFYGFAFESVLNNENHVQFALCFDEYLADVYKSYIYRRAKDGKQFLSGVCYLTELEPEISSNNQAKI